MCRSQEQQDPRAQINPGTWYLWVGNEKGTKTQRPLCMFILHATCRLNLCQHKAPKRSRHILELPHSFQQTSQVSLPSLWEAQPWPRLGPQSSPCRRPATHTSHTNQTPRPLTLCTLSQNLPSEDSAQAPPSEAGVHPSFSINTP